MWRSLIAVSLVVTLSDVASAEKAVVVFSFEDPKLKEFAIYQSRRLLGFSGELVAVELPDNEQGASIGVGSRKAGDYGVVDFDYHFNLKRRGDTLELKAVDSWGGCFTAGVEVVSPPDVSVREDPAGVFHVQIGQLVVKSVAPKIACAVTPVRLTIRHQPTRIVSDPPGAKIRIGEETTTHTTPSVMRLPLEHRDYSYGEGDPSGKASLTISLTKEGYVNRDVVVTEGQRRVNVVLQKP